MQFYCTLDVDSVSKTLHEYMPNVPVMLPASSWARYKLKKPTLPAHITSRAADCGGFVATRIWGDYRYSPQEYVDWLHTFQPQWAATMDYCCEDEITSGKRGIVQERQQKTSEMAYLFWEVFNSAPWAWVPTIQGWKVDEYRQHARQMRPLIQEMQRQYGDQSAFRVGIGTLCRRASVPMIHKVIAAVSEELPGVPLHLWGIKLGAFKAFDALPGKIASVDSAAWNSLWGTNREEWRKSGLIQRRFTYSIALPRYLAKVEEAINTPKQLKLFA